VNVLTNASASFEIEKILLMWRYYIVKGQKYSILIDYSNNW
jgi:hypothetical protein